MALPGQHDHDAVAAPDDDRLVTRGVPGRRHDVHAGQHLGLAVQLLVPQTRRVDELGQGVVGGAGGLELGALRHHRTAGELRVAAAVVEVQVAVDDERDVVEPRAGRRQRGPQQVAPGPVVRVDVVRGAHAGVEQEQPGGVVDEVPEDRLDPRAAGAGLLRGPHEVPVVDPPDTDGDTRARRHAPTLPCRLRARRQGVPRALILRQPPARLSATTARSSSSRASAGTCSPRLTATVRAVELPCPAVMMPCGSGARPPS